VIEGTFAQRFFSVPMAALYVEVPVAKTLDVDVGFGNNTYTALFIVPGVKLKLAPAFPISPYFSFGVGYARFSQNVSGATADLVDTSSVVGTAVGADIKVAPFVSLRGEFRDFYAGRPALTLPLPGAGRQHNIIGSAGIVLRF
jgi:hypothetical protein